jgi:hypothetical protein
VFVAVPLVEMAISATPTLLESVVNVAPCVAIDISAVETLDVNRVPAAPFVAIAISATPTLDDNRPIAAPSVDIEICAVLRAVFIVVELSADAVIHKEVVPIHTLNVLVDCPRREIIASSETNLEVTVERST